MNGHSKLWISLMNNYSKHMIMPGLFLQSQAPSYQKVAILWVMSAKKEKTRLKHLNILIEDSENNRRLTVVTLEPKKMKE